MPHVLTQHNSSGMRTAEKREGDTDPSMLVRCFNARIGCPDCRGAFSRQTTALKRNWSLAKVIPLVIQSSIWTWA